jgi:hypothetical protein
MARFEVVVEEFSIPPGGAPGDLAPYCVPLSDILRRTGGRYVCHVQPPEHLRRHWQRISTDIGESRLTEITRSATIPVSLEHLRSRDASTVGITIRFERSSAPLSVSSSATTLDESEPLL